MKYAQGEFGRIFVMRLEDGEILHETIESFASDNNIKSAAVLLVGGVDDGSKLVVGPKDGRSEPILPMEYIIKGVHEASGVGTIFPDENSKPVLHMHTACGREDKTRTGCVRRGVKIWHIGEVIIIEITRNTSIRKKDATTGFELLEPSN